MITQAFTNFQGLSSESHIFAALSHTSFCYFTYLDAKLTLFETHFQGLAFWFKNKIEKFHLHFWNSGMEMKCNFL